MNDLTVIFSSLAPQDVTRLQSISANLANAWHKRQVFRTETEARISVLNDAHFPTTASKYWQSVREQTVMLDNLTIQSFDMRRNKVELKKAQQAVEKAENELDREAAQIDVDECLFKLASGEQVARDRVREIMLWEQIKAELNDGTFDTEDVNSHQIDSLQKQLSARAQTITQATPQGEVMNILGPLSTINKFKQLGG